MALNESIGVAVASQLCTQQVERTLETRLTPIQRKCVVAICITRRVPQPRVGNQAPHSHRLGCLGNRSWGMGGSSLEEAGRAIADHFETRERRAGVLGFIVERVQEGHEEPRLYIRE